MSTNEAASSLSVEESVDHITNGAKEENGVAPSSENPSVVNQSPVRKSSIQRELGELSEGLFSLAGLPALRKRKSVELYSPELPREPTPLIIQKGLGEKLGDIEKAAQHIRGISRNSTILMDLHKVIFGKGCPLAKLKDNLLNYSGVSATESAKEKDKLTNRLSKHTRPEIVEFIEALGLSKQGIKDELVSRLSDFLEKPGENAYHQTPKKPKKAETPEENGHATSISKVPTPKKNTPPPKDTKSSKGTKVSDEAEDSPKDERKNEANDEANDLKEETKDEPKNQSKDDSKDEPKESGKHRKLARRTPSSSILVPLSEAIAALTAEAKEATGTAEPTTKNEEASQSSAKNHDAQESEPKGDADRMVDEEDEAKEQKMNEDKVEDNALRKDATSEAEAEVSFDADVAKKVETNDDGSTRKDPLRKESTEKPTDSVFPPDEDIVEKIKELIPTVDLESTTPRQVKEALERLFGVLLDSKSDFITQTIRTLLSEGSALSQSAAPQ